MILISKNFRFESAHRIASGYQGKCKNIHGHSWNGVIRFKDTGELNNYGMSVDYATIKEFIVKIEDAFDHKLLLNKEDEDLITLCKKENWDFVVFDNNPTSEVLAKEIYQYAKECKFLNNFIEVYEVEVEETCTSKCIYKE